MGVERHHDLDCDILVAGGGAAGVPCALAAARNGAKVVLCQDRPVLGGNASSEIRLNIMGADVFGKRGLALATEAREGGILEEIRLEAAYRNPQRSATVMDLILYEKCYEEPNLTLMLNTVVDGAHVVDGSIISAHATRTSTEDAFTIRAKTYIDCTGDGRLGAEAGAVYDEGRESSSEFGESKANEEKDNYRLGSTLLFLARDMGHPMRFVPPKFARHYSEEDLQHRAHQNIEYGYWWIEWGGMVDTIKDNEQIKHELLAILMGVWDHIKNGGERSAENWALDWFGWVPGKRESRRFWGQYRLTQSDLAQAKRFPDAIAYGGWAMDTHPPQGMDALGTFPGTRVDNEFTEYLYEIPLRACVSNTIDNLMFAGRNISASHIAFSSTRVMGTCAVIGQGVGTAAAMGIRSKTLPRDMAADATFMQHVQQKLLLDDCFIPGAKNGDTTDLAQRARVAASSCMEPGWPSEILSGETRATHGIHGVRPGLTEARSHRWRSDPQAGLPAWIELEWDEPQTLQKVQIVFDTGLHRPLTHTHLRNFYDSDMVWGPQPETVKSYRLSLAVGDSGPIQVAEETNNYQRRRVHTFAPTVVNWLRLEIEETWGLAEARVVEIRCY